MSKGRASGRIWPMNELHEAFIQGLGDDRSNISPEKLEGIISALTKKVAIGIEKDLLDRAPKMLLHARKDQVTFETRNIRRWRAAFDLFETIWVCCEEMGRNFNQHFRPEAVETQDFVFEAVTAIHAKSLLVTNEMICLMRGGFADAALTRWRTLHELNVVATLIVQHGSELAMRYLAHADVQAADRIEENDQEKLSLRRQRKEYALARFGDDLKRHYGWACDVTGKKAPTFKDIEGLANKSDGRALYQHASHHIHSNHRIHDELLGMAETEEVLLLVGPSNSGMTGPLTLGAITIIETTALYLTLKPNFDRSVYTLVLGRMAQRLYKLAGTIEKRTLDAARKRQARKLKT